VFVTPEHQIIFQRVGAQGIVVAVGFEIKENARALINAAGNGLEPEADPAILEIVDASGNGKGIIGVGLHIIQKFGIPLTIQGPGLVGQAGRWHAAPPGTAIHHQHLVVPIHADEPVTHGSGKAFGWRAHGFS